MLIQVSTRIHTCGFRTFATWLHASLWKGCFSCESKVPAPEVALANSIAAAIERACLARRTLLRNRLPAHTGTRGKKGSAASTVSLACHSKSATGWPVMLGPASGRPLPAQG